MQNWSVNWIGIDLRSRMDYCRCCLGMTIITPHDIITVYCWKLWSDLPFDNFCTWICQICAWKESNDVNYAI